MLPIRLTSAALPLIKALDAELGKENPSETIIKDKLQALNGSMGWDRFYKAPLRWESTPGSGWTQASSQYQMMKLRLMYGCPFRHETVGNEVAGLLYPAEQESIGLLQVCCGMDTVILPPLDYKCLRYEVHEPLLEGLMFGIWVPHKRFYECGACGIPIPLDNGPPNLSNIISSGTGSARPDYDGPKALDLQRLVEALGNHVHNYQRHLYNAGHYLQYFGPDDMEPRPFTLKLYPFCFMDHPFFTSGITAQAMLDHLNWHRLPTPVAALAQALWYYISNNYNLGAYVHKKAGRLIVWQLCSDEFARGVVSSDTPFELRRGTCPYDRRVHEALQGLADFNYVPRFPPPPPRKTRLAQPVFRPLRPRRGSVIPVASSRPSHHPRQGDSVVPTSTPRPSYREEGSQDPILSSSLTTGEWSPRTQALYDVLDKKFVTTKDFWIHWFGSNPEPIPLADRTTIVSICAQNGLEVPSGLVRTSGNETLVPGQSSSSSSSNPVISSQEPYIDPAPLPFPPRIRSAPASFSVTSSANVVSLGSTPSSRRPDSNVGSVVEEDLVSIMSAPSRVSRTPQALLLPRNVVSDIPLDVTRAFERFDIPIPESPVFGLNFSHDYAYLIPRFYAPNFYSRYEWLWKWEVGQEASEYREWKQSIQLAKPVLDNTCYKHLDRPYGINHATMAGLFDEQLLQEPIAGRVLFISGLLSGSKRFGEFDNYLPSPAALLRWIHEAGVAAHLVVYHTEGLRPYGNIGNSANVFLCCPRHTDEALFRLTRQAAVRPFREGTILLIGRSDKAFTTTLCDDQGRQSGLSLAEAQLAHLFTLQKVKAVNQALVEYESVEGTTAGNYKVLGKYLPKAFTVRDDEWVSTSFHEVEKAHRPEWNRGRAVPHQAAGRETSSLNDLYRSLPESADDIAQALSTLGRQYRVKTKDGLRPLNED